MSNRGKTLLKGHALHSEGYRAVHAPPSISNYHLAECQCGALSPTGLSIRERKQWHREHKDALR